jgi:4'-phosphopantetheinyl transferase
MTSSYPVEKPRVLEYQFDEVNSTNLPLPSDEIHIWQRRLRCDPHAIQALEAVLHPDELTRAARFHFPSNRDEFIVSRGTLRLLLGRYLNCSPGQLHFTYSQYGRPQLDGSRVAERVEFNISHSGDIIVLAFTRARRIGIDIERIRTDFSTAEIADRFFSFAEREALHTLPAEQRHDAFFTCWTRKEAFIKALGEGLSHPLEQFDVSLTPGSPPAVLATRPEAQEARRWSLWDINVPPGYAAALAAEIASVE